MVREITLYTRKEQVVNLVRERLQGSDVSVVVDDTFQGVFQDPRFDDHLGRRFVGYEPLLSYIEQVGRGIQDSVLDNPLGDAMRVAWSKSRNPLLKDPLLFGTYFSQPGNTKH